MKHWKTALVSVSLVAALAGCSGSESPAPTVTGGSSPTGATSAPEETDTSGVAWCEDGEVTDEVDVAFGEMAAASDEWSEAMGREWRHYFPVTITNASDKPCFFTVKLEASVEGGTPATETISVPLKAGQSYKAQAFDLEEAVEFSADAQDATPSAAVTPSYTSAIRSPLLDYYTTELTVDGIAGKGGDAKLSSTITMVEQKEGVPERLASAQQDSLVIVGLDAAGDVIALGSDAIDPIAPGESLTIETLAGGGDSSRGLRQHVPLSNYEQVATWEIGMLQPVYTDITKLLF